MVIPARRGCWTGQAKLYLFPFALLGQGVDPLAGLKSAREKGAAAVFANRGGSADGKSQVALRGPCFALGLSRAMGRRLSGDRASGY